MGYPLNPEQSEAVSDFGSDLLVTAGAGTGKTSVLINKFLRLLEERRAKVGEIVAITFTKKAAAEMRERIRAQINHNLQTTKSPEEMIFWKNQWLELERARIGTFHSFCLGLIREHPLEAGISPVTGVLDAGEEKIYINQAIESGLTGYLKSPEVPDRDRKVLLKILTDFGWEGFRDSIAAVYQTIREGGTGFDEVIELSAAGLQAAIAGNNCQTNHLREEVEELLDFSRTVTLTERAAELLGSLRTELPFYRDALLSNDLPNDILPALDGLKKALPKNMPNTIKDRVSALRDTIDAYYTKLLDQETLERLPVIGAILKRVDRYYFDAKQALGYLDFRDQLLLARNLLRNHPEITREIKAGIRYILVDEFQDTNGLQMEILELLRGKGYQSGRLMVVGDIKQSIYRFRGAEADLIIKLSADFKVGNGRLIPLTRNYRSAPIILRFVNRISGALFSGEPFEYQSLEAVRNDQDAGIEFILGGNSDRLNNDDLINQQFTEARTVARRIRQLVENSSETGTFQFGDIAILFRTKTAIPIYQKALQEQEIPCYTAGGGNFYRCPEVVDQLNILRVTLKRYDGIALLGLLASPYVGLSDESLLWLARGRDLVRCFYENDDWGDEIPADECRRLIRFRELLNLLQKQREYLGIPGILRAALDHCQYREVLWSFPDAGQRVANLEKLLAKADEFAAKGFHDLHRFLTYIEELEGVEVIEGEAPTEMEAGNVVRLMTIHRAKGLEFPVVFIPDLDRQFSRNIKGRIAFHKKAGLSFGIKYSENETGFNSNWERIKALNRREDLSELKRLLYVGLTRARQRLFLAGSGHNKSKAVEIEKADNWMKWFELLLPLQKAGPTLEFEGIPIRITRESPETGKRAPAADILARIAQMLEGEAVSLTPVEPEIAATVLAPVITPITLKVTGLLTFKDCPRRYYLRRRLRLAEVNRKSFFLNEEDRVDAGWEVFTEPDLGARIGKFIHQAARYPGSDWPEELWSSAFSDRNDAARAALKIDLWQMWTNFRKSPFTEDSGECWDEAPFTVKLNQNVYVEGRFDRLIRDRDGRLVLVDYKTHRVREDRAGLVAEPYFWQLQLYALAVETLWGSLPDRAALYFMYPDRTVEVPLERGVLERVKTEVVEIGEFIRTHDRLEEYRKGDGCEECGYGGYCGRVGR
jgi:ATP-dependent helicase/nuclease subunit A